MPLSKRIRAALKLHPYIWPKDKRMQLRLLFAVILLLTSIFINIGVPLILKQVIDMISSPQSITILSIGLLISYGFAWTINKVMNQLRQIAINRVIERGMRLMCLNILDHLLSLSLRYHSSRKTGGLISLIERAQDSFWPLFLGVCFIIVPTLIEIVFAAVILTYMYGFTYGGILALVLTIYMVFSIWGSQWSSRAQSISNERYSEVSSAVVDNLLNYETIRYFGTRKHEHTRCDKLLDKREDAATRQHFTGELVQLIQGVILGIGLIILTYLSGSQVMNGSLKVSDFVLINVYLLQFMNPLGIFGYILRDTNKGLTNFEEVVHLLSEQPEIQDKKNAISLTTNNTNITFENVTFGYDENRLVIQGISFKIPAKKTVAIVGATGGGKSTISKLLFRYYDVLGGRICIDKHDIRDVTQDSLQSAIGVVPQNTSLFNETILFNISYGSPEAGMDEIQSAIKKAHLDKFIASLPNGLDTMVGEHGLQLSGGERQRVAIARVLLKKPAIFVFDEATSSLDTKTEQLIQNNISEVSKDSTTLIIAHRLSTIIHADEIIVLDHGKIVEQGIHADLIKKGGLYAHLWAKQTGIKTD
ncbi:MAG: ATP-binding cassette domain-containing protein [Legionellaceae bacterium]|nr:ATP-binding cassette domain-containing protein [Legionellaceae bacterium]